MKKAKVENNYKKIFDALTNKKVKGYLTLEAAVVVPIILFCVVFVQYCIVYRYNLVIATLNSSIVAIEYAQNVSNDVLDDQRFKMIDYKKNYAYGNIYILYEEDAFNINRIGNNVTVTCRGNVYFPFGGYDFMKGINTNWNIQVENKIRATKSGDFMRALILVDSTKDKIAAE